MSENNLSERELKIFEYIRNNPGRSKEDVARGMKGNPSRITVLKILEKLEQEKMIIARKAKPNSQIYRLFINEESLIVSITLYINEFEKAFFSLLDNVSQRFTEREANFNVNYDDSTDIIDDNDISKLEYVREKYRIIDALVLLYRHFFGMYILHAMFKWSKNPDEQTLNKLHGLFFNSIKKIQIKLLKVVWNRIHHISDPIIYNLFELKPDKLDNFFKYFQEFGLLDQAEQVLDHLWDISSDFVPPSFYMYYMQQKTKEPIHAIPQSLYKISPILQEMNKAGDWRTAIKIWKSISKEKRL